jgi:polysaccharide deacetylase family sporulation protein PdaB
MRFFVINTRTAAKSFAVIIIAVVFVLCAGVASIQAFSVYLEEKQLPVYSVECAEKKAAITFDCAWGADDIPDILETLKKEDVKATFFIVGQWAEKFPDKVKMISEAGHDIGNHGYSHLRMSVLDRNKIQSEITDCNNVLQKLTGKNVDLFRPPYGDYDNKVVSSARTLGCFTIQWNVDSLDWKPEISREEIKNRIKARLVPGSILLFHNSTKHTANILGDIIKQIKSEGYELVPVSGLIIREDFTIDFEGRQHPASK